MLRVFLSHCLYRRCETKETGGTEALGQHGGTVGQSLWISTYNRWESKPVDSLHHISPQT